MTRSDMIHHPEAIREREALRRECEADLRVWVAASGAALPVRLPKPANEEKRND
jgi:hypothetical protein